MIFISFLPGIKNCTIIEADVSHCGYVAHEYCATGANFDVGVVICVEINTVCLPIKLKPLLILTLVSETDARLCRVQSIVEINAVFKADVIGSGLFNISDSNMGFQCSGILKGMIPQYSSH